MLEGWELTLIFGGIAVTMLAGMMAAILYFLSSPKIITIQSYATQQYSQKIAPQYPYVGSTCSQCGLSAASNAKFCSNCGKQLI